MPVEIRELIIKAVVREPGEGKKSPEKITALDRDEIIADCVEEVLRILKEKNER